MEATPWMPLTILKGAKIAAILHPSNSFDAVVQPRFNDQRKVSPTIKLEQDLRGSPPYDSYVCYFDHITSDILVGSWHVLLPIEVASWAPPSNWNRI